MPRQGKGEEKRSLRDVMNTPSVLDESGRSNRLSLQEPSIPACGVLWKTRALNSYNAESLPSGGLHHHPAFQAINHLCS